MNEQTNERIDEWKNERTNERQTNKWTNERTNEWMNEQANDPTNQRMNEQIGERTKSSNVNKYWKTRAKGNDVITNVISANQHFASTVSMQILKYQRGSCKLSFLFPPRRQSAPESLLELTGLVLFYYFFRLALVNLEEVRTCTVLTEFCSRHLNLMFMPLLRKAGTLFLYLLGPFIRGKIRRVLHKTRTFRINGTFRLK